MTKSKFIHFAVSLTLLVMCSACQDVIELDVPDGKTKLVVDGLLTDKFETQTIKLTYTTPYFSNREKPKVSGATVYITDTEGHKAIFEETAAGIYQKKVGGKMGSAYQLTVETNGTIYKSPFELLKPVPPIEFISYDYIEKSLFSDNEGYYAYIHLSDPEGIENFYRWKLYVNGIKESAPQDLLFDSDRLVDGVEGLTVSFFNSPLLLDDIAKVEQLSMNENAYDFLFMVREQTAEIGSQFDTPPAPIEGNMMNVSDSSDYALGYFMVSAVKSAEIVIEE